MILLCIKDFKLWGQGGILPGEGGNFLEVIHGPLMCPSTPSDGLLKRREGISFFTLRVTVRTRTSAADGSRSQAEAYAGMEKGLQLCDRPLVVLNASNCDYVAQKSQYILLLIQYFQHLNKSSQGLCYLIISLGSQTIPYCLRLINLIHIRFVINS